MISVLGVLVEISQPWVSFPVSSFEEFELLINTPSESESTRQSPSPLALPFCSGE